MIGSDFTNMQAQIRAQASGGLSQPALPKAGEGKSDARRAAEGFEAFFLRQIMADMRNTSLGEDIFGSSATRNFQEMSDANLANSISESGGFGIASLLEKQFSAFSGDKTADADIRKA